MCREAAGGSRALCLAHADSKCSAEAFPKLCPLVHVCVVLLHCYALASRWTAKTLPASKVAFPCPHPTPHLSPLSILPRPPVMPYSCQIMGELCFPLQFGSTRFSGRGSKATRPSCSSLRTPVPV